MELRENGLLSPLSRAGSAFPPSDTQPRAPAAAATGRTGAAGGEQPPRAQLHPERPPALCAGRAPTPSAAADRDAVPRLPLS